MQTQTEARKNLLSFVRMINFLGAKNGINVNEIKDREEFLKVTLHLSTESTMLYYGVSKDKAREMMDALTPGGGFENALKAAFNEMHKNDIQAHHKAFQDALVKKIKEVLHEDTPAAPRPEQKPEQPEKRGPSVAIIFV